MTVQIYNSPRAFRASDETDRQIRELMLKWGENRSKVITRCIERVWLQEVALKRDVEGADNDGGRGNE